MSLAEEALPSRGVSGVLGPYELQRDVAAEDAVTRPIDDAHPARAESLEDVEMRDRPRLHAGLRFARAAERRCPGSSESVAGNHARRAAKGGLFAAALACGRLSQGRGVGLSRVHPDSRTVSRASSVRHLYGSRREPKLPGLHTLAAAGPHRCFSSLSEY